jgi:hypothetical protein
MLLKNSVINKGQGLLSFDVSVGGESRGGEIVLKKEPSNFLPH